MEGLFKGKESVNKDRKQEGVKTAAEMIDSGKALKKLEELVELTNRG